VNSNNSLEERVSYIEGYLGLSATQPALTKVERIISLVILILAVIAIYLGVGPVNHYYQVIFALLCIALAYHRGWILGGWTILGCLTGFVNVVFVSLVLKVFLGAGVARPLSWVKVPTLSSENVEGVGKYIPQISMKWEALGISDFSLDLTIIQTFVLLFTLIGGLFGFQPFASFTALFLLILSFPMLISFNWEWVLAGFILGAVALYLQGGKQIKLKTYSSK